MPTKRIRDSERRRCPRACENCKRRKEKCDGLLPCRRCVVRRVQGQCTFLASSPAAAAPARPHPVPDAARSRSSGTTTANSTNRRRPDDEGSTGPSSTEILSTALSPSQMTMTMASPGQERLYSSSSSSSPQQQQQIFHRSPAAPVPHLSRLIRDARGKFMFIGDAANLSFLQVIRRVVSESLGSCPFVDDPLRSHMVEASPEGRAATRWLAASLAQPPPRPSPAEAANLLRWYQRATACILNLYEDAELKTQLAAWTATRRKANPETSSDNDNNNIDDDDDDDQTAAIFFLILAVGAQTCPDQDGDDTAERYFNYGRFLTTSAVTEDPSVATVRAYMLITMYLLGASRRNAAFMYLGIAVRAAYALGLHRGDVGALFRPAERATREKLWRSLRVLDLFLSASLGRPPSTSETRNTSTSSTTENDGDSATNHLCFIFESILNEVYAKRMVSTEVLERISEQHRRWAACFRDGLRTDSIEPGDVLACGENGKTPMPNIGLYHLKELYYWTIMLLTRPFLIEAVSRHVQAHRGPPLDEHGDNHELQSAATPSDHLLSHACIDSAIRTVDLLQGLLQAATDGVVPKRLPFMVNSLFVSGLVLGLAVFGDLDRLFPLEKTLATAHRLLHKLSAHDAVGQRDAAIIAHLQAACDRYLERRTRLRMERQGLLVGGLFGSVDQLGRGTTHTQQQQQQQQLQQLQQQQLQQLQQQQQQDASSGVPRQILSPETDAEVDQRGASATAVAGNHSHLPLSHTADPSTAAMHMLPDAAGSSSITDMILPMSPRTLLFDSYYESQPLFPTVDARLIQTHEFSMGGDGEPDAFLMLGPV